MLVWACVCFTSGERRVQLLVDEPVLPVLLLLSDIALVWLNTARCKFYSTIILQNSNRNVSSLSVSSVL